MANPFFSGRIPQDLLNRIEQHVKETGQSKTDVLIQALAVYLNHPVSKLAPVTTSSEIEERFKSLEVRISALELEVLFGKASNEKSAIKLDNNSQLNMVLTDNFDNKPDNKTLLVEEDFWQKNSDNDSDNIDENVSIATAQHQKEPVHLLPEHTSTTLNADNNFDNNGENTSKIATQHQEEPIHLLPEHIPAQYESLTSSELTEMSNLKQTQIDSYKGRIIKKYQKLGQPLENKQMLESPEKIETKQLIVIRGYPYDLFYLGQSEKGSNLWSAIPYDNNRYQQLSIESSFEEILDSSK